MINSMNLFRQDNCTPEMKMSKLSINNHKVLEFCLLTHRLTTTIDQPPKLLGLWCTFFPTASTLHITMKLVNTPTEKTLPH